MKHKTAAVFKVDENNSVGGSDKAYEVMRALMIVSSLCTCSTVKTDHREATRSCSVVLVINCSDMFCGARLFSRL